jgi:glycosyltransferase involved in cell wall biosynthesis
MSETHLYIDLAFDAGGDRVTEDGIRRIGFHAIAAAAKSPHALLRLLRSAHSDTVVVMEDGLPLSGVQAVALVIVGLVPARRWVLAGGARELKLSRARFLAAALRRLPLALARELFHSVRLRHVVLAVGKREHHLPRRIAHPSSVLYMRAEPTIRWQGAFVGGAATHTAGVIDGLVANGVSVHALAPQPLSGITNAEVTIVSPRRALHLVHGLNYADYSQAVTDAIGRARADFVYQRYALGAFAGLELARRLGVPLVLEFNGSGLWVERHWGPGHVRMAGPLTKLERRNLIDASLIVVISEVLKEQLIAQGIPATRILVNPNGVDVERLAPYSQRSPSKWRKHVGLSQAPTVGFVGTFGPWHGVELLPKLIAATPSANWILIGAGDPLHGRVTAEIDARGLRERVLISGLVPRERALELLSACDVCVSPHVPNPDGSRFFGSPTKLFEYMGLAKPIVASDLDQIGAVIEHERNGLLHRPGDVTAAAMAIERLLADPALRERLGGAALAHAQERYSWSAHVRRTLDALAAAA